MLSNLLDYIGPGLHNLSALVRNCLALDYKSLVYNNTTKKGQELSGCFSDCRNGKILMLEMPDTGKYHSYIMFVSRL